MKVLLVNDYGTPTGGAEILMLQLRASLRQRGHDAQLFTSDARVGGRAVQADETCLGTLTGARTLLQVANFAAVRRLRRIVSQFRPDVAHVELFLTQLSPLILNVLRDVPVLYHAEWYRAVCPLGTKRLPDGTACTFPWGPACVANRCIPVRDFLPLLIQRELLRRSKSAFDRVIACSNAVRDRLLEGGIGPVQVVWNGVPERPARPPLSPPPIIGVAARLTPEKGVDVLIEAFARAQTRLPELRLEIFGDGPERSRLERRVQELRLCNVELAGHVSRPELESRLDRAWVQVAPSLWQEPFGMVAAEAMMRGTAVVATRVGGHPEFVHDGRAGLLVPPGDVSALECALLALAGDRATAERMGVHGRAFALQHLSQDIFVDRIVNIYHEMLGAC